MNTLPKPFYIIAGLCILVLIAGAEIIVSSVTGNGRYSLVTVGSGDSPDVYMMDTKTGHVWRKITNQNHWTDLTPTSANTDTGDN